MSFVPDGSTFKNVPPSFPRLVVLVVKGELFVVVAITE